MAVKVAHDKALNIIGANSDNTENVPMGNVSPGSRMLQVSKQQAMIFELQRHNVEVARELSDDIKRGEKLQATPDLGPNTTTIQGEDGALVETTGAHL